MRGRLVTLMTKWAINTRRGVGQPVGARALGNDATLNDLVGSETFIFEGQLPHNAVLGDGQTLITGNSDSDIIYN